MSDRPGGEDRATPTVGARFDDALADEALVFPAPDRIAVARTPGEVRAVLADVEHAADAGRWAFGFVAYEAATALDADRPTATPDRTGLPLAWFGISAAPCHASAVTPTVGEPHYWTAPWVLDWSPARHTAAVRHVQDTIAAGGVYQANVTTTLTGRALGDLTELYADLVHAQSGRYNAYLDIGSHTVLSASPELFFQWRPPLLHCRPMKGTAPRGRTVAEDETNRERLLASTKDVAENIMIVDLIRNDLGRLARTGTVQVPHLLTAEPYESVWQLTSDITAEPRPGTTFTEILTALFPSGSVTGAPKRAAMQTIGEVEDAPRGVYCGAIGWLAPPEHPVRARFNVAIRTVVIDRYDQRATYGAGGGITAPSDPAEEYAELIAKTAVLELVAQAGPTEPLHLLETFAYRPGRGFDHLDRHLARLRTSAGVFGFAFDDGGIRAALARAVDGRSDVRVARVALRLAGDGRITVGLSALNPPSAQPVRLALDRHPVRSDSLWLHHKTSRRAVYDGARSRHPEADDVILVNERGELTETTIATLAIRLDGRWRTPPLAAGCLPGIGRAVAIDAGRLSEHTLTPADLDRAEEIAVLSSLRGWRAARLG